MICKCVYLYLKIKYSKIASWTIWADPADGDWSRKSNIDDLSIFNCSNITKKLNSNYIFVAYNPANHNSYNTQMPSWASFHSGNSKKSQDYKLRCALHGTKYEGSFIIDLYPEIIETDSTKVESKTNSIMTKKSIYRLLKIRKVLGNKATIVAIGADTHKILKNLLPKSITLKSITHYATFVNPVKYRAIVLSNL